ncbi:hypothetical protein [Xylophilus sp. GOD-11R]|uniref:hypothetical protein n=1 Tax=Xylophilus sp. GOD-11R TaxID=3089814 RepID=UPI00298CBCA1|nr:hypothetical protein [Xylophilus sp. GOD-11R]WPB55642.1 hypothetical protein R9X41_16025 [Xylophilus sp. GOD-11R]
MSKLLPLERSKAHSPGRAKQWPDRASSSSSRQLSLVTFFFARKESYRGSGGAQAPSSTLCKEKKRKKGSLRCNEQAPSSTPRPVEEKQKEAASFSKSKNPSSILFHKKKTQKLSESTYQ